MRILITGGSGFIGSHLCKSLLESGHFVICLDNCFSSDKSNIFDLMDYNNFEFIRHDITSPIMLEVDQIYNLACPASPIHYQKDPIKTVKTNVMGALNVLGLAKRLGAKILQASTSEIYGDPIEHPQKESYWGNVNSIGIRSCYDEGKRCAETLFFDYYRQHNVDIKIARIFNTYGPNMKMNDGRVVSNFIVQSLNNEDITVYGDGSQTRSFCYVEDTVKGLISLMNSSYTGPYNIGNPTEYCIKDIAAKIIGECGSTSNVVYLPLPQDDPKQRQPDITLAKKDLSWEPIVSFDDGLKLTIEYFKNINT